MVAEDRANRRCEKRKDICVRQLQIKARLIL